MPITGWKLDEADRAALLRRFAPRWPDIDADHVTLDARARDGTPLPEETAGKIVGHVDDGEGLEALVVAIGGTTDRPDGSVYHITWSLDRSSGRRPVESNDILAARGWTPLAEPIPIALVPACW